MWNRRTHLLLFGLTVLTTTSSSTINSENDVDKPRDFSGYPSAPISYDNYDSGSSYPAPDKWGPPSQPPSSPSLLFPGLGPCGSGSLMKPLLAGLIGAAIIKLPIIIGAKLLLLKMAAPVALLVAAAPLLVPLIYMMLSKNKGSGTMMAAATPSTTEGEGSSSFRSFLDSTSCMERIACSLGQTQARSSTVGTFSWLLKNVESMLMKQSEARSTVSSYRSAYLMGASTAASNDTSSSCAIYRCQIPELILRQGESSYKIF